MFDHTLFDNHKLFEDEFEEEYYYQESRAKMLKEMHDKETSVITNFMKCIGYNRPVAYYRNISDCELTIYTTNPGIIIGKRGVNVENLKSIMSAEFGGNWKVNFVEIRGDFANTDRDLNDTIDSMISVVKEWSKSTDSISCNTIIDMLELNKRKEK